MKQTLCMICCTIVRIFLEIISKIVIGIKYYGSQSQKLPPIQNLILMEPASSLAYKIRNKKITSEEVVKAFIDRIEEVNPIVNALVDNRFEEALEEARNVDKYLKSCSLSESEILEIKPFLGVPFTCKDSFSVKGIHHTSGLVARKDLVADSDADFVGLVKKAGAIIIGVTNIPELCMWWDTSNNIFGTTNNPYDTRRIAGGSSGGEGSLLSACGSAMGFGSDIGGSIRIPCLFNGIFGHKPSTGIVSNYGHYPEPVGKLQEYSTTGPMCRFSQDLVPMYKILAASNVHLLSLDEKVDLKNVKVYYMEDDGGCPIVTPVEKDLRVAQQKVLDHLKTAYDITPVKLHLKEFYDAVPIFFAKLKEEKKAHTFASELNMKKGEINVWWEIVKRIFGLSSHTAPALFFAFLEKLSGNDPQTAMELNDKTDKLKTELKEILGKDGILIYPSHPTTALYHSQTLYRPWNFAYTAIFNILGLPVTQCPLGLNADGLPLGIQVVGNLHQDHLCLAVAGELEKAFGGWVCPSQVL